MSSGNVQHASRAVLGELNSNLLRSTSASRGKRARKFAAPPKTAWKAGALTEFREATERPLKTQRSVSAQCSLHVEHARHLTLSVADLEADISAYQLEVSELRGELGEVTGALRSLQESCREKDRALAALRLDHERRSAVAQRSVEALEAANSALEKRNRALVVEVQSVRADLYQRTRQLCEERTKSLRDAFSRLERPRASCCICLEPLESTRCSVTDCGHVFHTTCISDSLAVAPRCPTCRAPGSARLLRGVFL